MPADEYSIVSVVLDIFTTVLGWTALAEDDVPPSAADPHSSRRGVGRALLAELQEDSAQALLGVIGRKGLTLNQLFSMHRENEGLHRMKVCLCGLARMTSRAGSEGGRSSAAGSGSHDHSRAYGCFFSSPGAARSSLPHRCCSRPWDYFLRSSRGACRSTGGSSPQPPPLTTRTCTLARCPAPPIIWGQSPAPNN